MLYVADISHHKAGFSVPAAVRQGIDGFLLKATEGSGFVDDHFAGFLHAAWAAGKPVGAYHYQRPVSVADQVARIRKTVPHDCTVCIDVEAGSGSIALTRQLVAALRDAGYRVPLSYIPRWYWLQLGRPSLAGLPPLWSSRYPSMAGGSPDALYARVPVNYWAGYGGLSVALLQFSSSATLGGEVAVDVSAHRGTPDQLAALLNGTQPEDDMGFTVKQLLDTMVELNWPGTPGKKVRQSVRNLLASTYAGVYAPGMALDRLKHLEAGHAALSTAVAGIAADHNVTAEQLRQMIYDAVAGQVQITGDVAITSRVINEDEDDDGTGSVPRTDRASTPGQE